MDWGPLINKRYRIQPEECKFYSDCKSKGNDPMLYAKAICDGL